MRPIKTKAQIRAEIDAQIASYTQGGGSVSEHNVGDSGREPKAALPPAPFVEGSNQTRTLVTDEVTAIEERRKKTTPVPTLLRPKKPRRVLITDDFGEPLRWVWKD